MSELFTTGPYVCGEYDPTTKYHVISSLAEDDLIYYCTIRNIYGVTASTIAILGIMGNIICLMILPKTGGTRSAILLLFTLGIYDTLFLASGIFLKYLPSISIFGHMPVVLSNGLSPLMFPINLLAHLGSSYTTIAISIERCIAISAPFKVSQWLTTTRIKVVIAIILIWSIGYNIPRVILLTPTEYVENSLNRTWIRLEPTTLAMNIDFIVIYFGYFNTIFKAVIPIVTVSLSNTILLCCLRRRHSLFVEHVNVNSGSSRSANNTDARVTSMVLAVTWTFLISQAFAGIQVLLHLTGQQARCGQPCAVFNQFCDVINVLVAATNFLLYYAFGQRFRKIIKDTLCRKRHASHQRRRSGSGFSASRSTRRTV